MNVIIYNNNLYDSDTLQPKKVPDGEYCIKEKEIHPKGNITVPLLTKGTILKYVIKTNHIFCELLEDFVCHYTTTGQISSKVQCVNTECSLKNKQIVGVKGKTLSNLYRETSKIMGYSGSFETNVYDRFYFIETGETLRDIIKKTEKKTEEYRKLQLDLELKFECIKK